MPDTFRPLLLSLLLPLFSQAASAGPIEWSYKTEVVYAQDYGPRFTVALAPDGTVTATPGEADYVQLFTSTGVARPDPGDYLVRYDFDVRVTLTDVASGESAALTFAGNYASMWMYQPDTPADQWRWEWEASTFGDAWDTREVVLGANRYSVRAYGGGSGQFPFGEMGVQAAPLPVSATPEPGTLALAGIGLTGAIVRGRFVRGARG